MPATFCGLHHRGQPKLLVFEWVWCDWGSVLKGGKVDLLKKHWFCKLFGGWEGGIVEKALVL